MKIQLSGLYKKSRSYKDVTSWTLLRLTIGRAGPKIKNSFLCLSPTHTAVTTRKYSKSPKVRQNRIKFYYLLYCRFTSTAPINQEKIHFKCLKYSTSKPPLDFHKWIY